MTRPTGRAVGKPRGAPRKLTADQEEFARRVYLLSRRLRVQLRTLPTVAELARDWKTSHKTVYRAMRQKR